MTERRTESPRPGAAWLGLEGKKMSENTKSIVTADDIDVRPAAQSFHDYIAARFDMSTLTSAEIVELTFAFHSEWQSSDERKAERESAKVEREAKAAAARAAREAARKERLEAERKALEAKLAKLSK